MNNIGTKIRSRVFRTANDILAAKRDDERISKLEERYDLTNVELVGKLLTDLNNGRYRFETLLGEDFKDEIEDLYAKLKLEQKELNSHQASAKNIKKRKLMKQKKTEAIEKKQKNLEDYDAVMQYHILQELKKQKRKQRIIYALLSLVAFCCLSYVIFYYVQYEKNEADYNQLAEMKDEHASGTTEIPQVTVQTEDKKKPPILEKYKTLFQKNNRLAGWLKIEGTNIDYPVMHTVNNEYYLRRNFNQEYDKNGSLFIDKDCTPEFPNTNMIIYGHHMKSGRMFGKLDLYSKKSYFEKHPQIHFDTIYEEGIYDVMYVFRSHIYNEDEVAFKYYQFIDVNSSDEFYSAMDEMARMSFYDTGITAEYGDQLITLSTCDNTEEDGRFVVVAKKVK